MLQVSKAVVDTKDVFYFIITSPTLQVQIQPYLTIGNTKELDGSLNLQVSQDLQILDWENSRTTRTDATEILPHNIQLKLELKRYRIELVRMMTILYHLDNLIREKLKIM